MQALWETVRGVLKSLNIDTSHDTVTQLLGLFPKETKSVSLRGICPSMLIAASCTTAKM